MPRRCARPGCSEEPAATLWFDYRQRSCWLDPVDVDAHPMAYDLCQPHADSMTVPVGWRLEDRRSPRRERDAGTPEGAPVPLDRPLAS